MRNPPPGDIGWILWSGTVGLESDIQDRVEAAHAAGFTRLSVSPLDVERAAGSGNSPADLGRYLRDSGLQVVLDPVMNWYGGRPRPESRFGRFSADEGLRMAEALQVVSLTVLGQPAIDRPMAELAEPFGRFCDRAAAFGADVHLEFVPMTAITDLATAWLIVRGADRPNGGIVFDTWHFFRGNPDYGALNQVPGDRIFAVQIDDAAAEPRASLREDTQNRLLPGDGSFDLPTVVRELDRIGGLSWVGPEVISPALEAMPAIEAATLAGDRVRALIAQARDSSGPNA